MARSPSIRCFQARWAVLLALALLLLPDRSRATERPYEIGGAQQELGRFRELTERLSKQNLFYQLHLADQRKQDLHDTVAEMDRVLELLREGSTAYSVAPPPNSAIRAQIQQVDKAWGPVRRMAVASPYDYLRRANEFVPRRSRLGDPLFIHSFDRMSQALLADVDRLMELYKEECLKTGYELCDLAATHGIPIMLTERVVKQLVFIYTGRDEKRDVKELRETRDAIDAEMSTSDQLPILREATDPSRGDAAAFIAGLWSSIQEDWGRLRSQIDLAISGRAQEIDLKRVLKTQARLVETWERATVVMVRFIEAKYGTRP